MSKILAVLKHASLVALCVFATQAVATPAFYQGKVMTIVVPYGVGGHFDTWARMVAPYMAANLGLKSVRVVNRPGGGGLIGSNQIYSAAPDGLTIGDINAPGDYFAQIARAPGVHFKLQNFGWIGRPDDDPAAIAAHPDSAFHSIDDLMKLSPEHPVKVLATGKGSNEYNAAYITLRAFHVPFRMVAAFKGSHAVIAGFVAHEGDLMPMAVSHMVRLGQHARVILTLTKAPSSQLPHVPTVLEKARELGLPATTRDTLAQLVSVMSLGHTFVAPPGVPADRLAALRHAFAAAFHNPDFLKKAKAAGMSVGYVPGAEIERMVNASLQHKAEFIRLLSSAGR